MVKPEGIIPTSRNVTSMPCGRCILSVKFICQNWRFFECRIVRQKIRERYRNVTNEETKQIKELENRCDSATNEYGRRARTVKAE
jgi:Holliday junction resolvase